MCNKCTPYNVSFGRSARLPVDVLFKHNQFQLSNVNTPAGYAQDRSFVLRDTFDVVIQNLLLNKDKMQAQYNQKLRFIDHQDGDKVWLKVKFYKTGENRKLAPRRGGPWTVLRKLPNRVNFEIQNDKTKEKKIVHHDRLTPLKSASNTENQANDFDRQHKQSD